MLWAEADARKAAVVELSITRIFGQKKWMMHTMIPPKCDSIFVVLLNLREEWPRLNFSVIVGIKADKEKCRKVGCYALVRLVTKEVTQYWAGVCNVHDV